jgi:hypothetical protein
MEAMQEKRQGEAVEVEAFAWERGRSTTVQFLLAGRAGEIAVS